MPVLDWIGLVLGVFVFVVVVCFGVWFGVDWCLAGGGFAARDDTMCYALFFLSFFATFLSLI